MPATETQLQDLAILELGLTSDSVVTTNKSAWWSATDHISDLNLRKLYFKLAVCGYLMGLWSTKMNVTIGQDKLEAEAQFKHAQAMNKAIEVEIERTDTSGASVPRLKSARPTSILPQSIAEARNL